jgi:hypothetical protein
MTQDPNELERLQQAAAEQPASADDAPGVARYRYVLHAIRTLPTPAPPAGFAREIENCLQDHPEDSVAEQWLLCIAATGALALAVSTVAPWLATSMTPLAAVLGDVPWSLLAAIAGGLAGFALFDTLRSRMRSH